MKDNQQDIQETYDSEPKASGENPNPSPGVQEGDGTDIIMDDEIDLIVLAKTIWQSRNTIYYSVAVALVISLVYFFVSPPQYTASATLLPSTEKKGNSMGNLSALAGMAGINLGSMMGESSGIPAGIYPEVMNSYPFLNDFIHQKFHFEKYTEPISIFEFAELDNKVSFWTRVTDFWNKKPVAIKSSDLNLLISDDSVALRYGVIEIDKTHHKALESVKDIFLIDVDNKTDLVTISVQMQEPVLAAQYVQTAVGLLQRYIINYKTQQVRENLDFVQQRFNETKSAYEKAQISLYNYKDNHRNIVSERMDIEYQELNDSYDIAAMVYKGLAQQLEQSKISVKEETPVFTVLEPAKIPVVNSNTSIKIVLAVSIAIGAFIGIGLILVKLVWINISQKL